MTDAAEIIAESITKALAPGMTDYWSLSLSAIGIVVSGFAIWFAVLVPKKIAERQNKITLFDKRFEFYDMLCCCVGFAHMIQNIQTSQEIRMHFVSSFGRELIQDTTAENLLRDDIHLRWHAITVLKQGIFLFDFESEKWIAPLISSLTIIGSVSEKHERFWEYYGEFMDAARDVENNLLPKVEKSLQLGNLS